MALLFGIIAGLCMDEAVVRLIAKFKYGIWAAILPPATWFEIVKKSFIVLLVVFLVVTVGVSVVVSSWF